MRVPTKVDDRHHYFTLETKNIIRIKSHKLNK
jgi:hypothetical protein